MRGPITNPVVRELRRGDARSNIWPTVREAIATLHYAVRDVRTLATRGWL